MSSLFSSYQGGLALPSEMAGLLKVFTALPPHTHQER